MVLITRPLAVRDISIILNLILTGKRQEQGRIPIAMAVLTSSHGWKSNEDQDTLGANQGSVLVIQFSLGRGFVTTKGFRWFSFSSP